MLDRTTRIRSYAADEYRPDAERAGIPAFARHTDRVQPHRDHRAGAARVRLHDQTSALPVPGASGHGRLRQDGDDQGEGWDRGGGWVLHPETRRISRFTRRAPPPA